MSAILNIASKIYGRVLDTRNVLYDYAVFRSYKVPVPVISVGNITLGGTGKTPLVAYIARLLAEAGERPAIVSRGYRREDENSLVVVSNGEKIIEDPSVTGDEPLELALDLKGSAAVVCDADRVRGSVYAIERLGASVIVLDDAFQHRRIRRDLDIVVIDAGLPFGGRRTVPGGRLRENLHNLARADAIVVTRPEDSEDLEALRSELSDLNSDAPLFVCRSRVQSIETVWTSEDRQPDPDTTFFVFCAIGNPKSLLAQLEREGFAIAGSRSFPDHHTFTQDDIDEIEGQARAAGADALLTTGKDAVKLVDKRFGIPCCKVKSRLVIDDETALKSLLKSAMDLSEDS
ncbi:MAG: tetraacyldisaccharide 4'-kinase [Acidobacteriota bacterium]|nr:MAG: tetraacyldisaccharide 4'-kinase [Acidobacteriota bacterium]